jgi:aldehyde:ferredoxin oxidoreductase
MEMKGYMGQILRIDLSDGKISKEDLNTKWVEDFIGGSGLALRMGYDEIPPETDPLGSGGKLIFMTGPVTATSLGTSGRFEVVFKSPLTGLLCDSSSSGHWGAKLKQAGYDGLIVQGESTEPVYIHINDGEVEIESASELWGMSTYDVIDKLKEKTGEKKASVVTIGQAGENGVIYSCLLNDEGRTAGRGGAGAVMGKKKLKAIMVNGSGKPELADPEGFRKLALAVNKDNGAKQGLRDFGTASAMNDLWEAGDIPVKNWSKGSTEEIATKLGGRRMHETIHVPSHPTSCFRCPSGCDRWVKIEEGPYKFEGPGPEYETMAALGSMCLVDDLNAVAYANHLCNQYGLDTISCGSTIAFSMECYEKGILDTEQTGGLKLEWGKPEIVQDLIKKIAFGEGIGSFLAQGTRKMSEKLGRGTEDFAVHVKGMEIAMHDPRAYFSMGTTYATSPRGGCHLHGMSIWYELRDESIPEWDLPGAYPRQSDEHKGKMVKLAQSHAHILNSMVMCYFATSTLAPSDMAALINSATGSTLTPGDLLTIGDRIHAVHRSYNYRCGVRRKDDKLPKRLMTPLAEGGTGGKVPDVERHLEEYYRLRDWEADGRPSKRSLEQLDLPEIAADLYK